MTFDLLRYGQIYVVVAVPILEEVARHLQLFLSGEQNVAYGPLV